MVRQVALCLLLAFAGAGCRQILGLRSASLQPDAGASDAISPDRVSSSERGDLADGIAASDVGSTASEVGTPSEDGRTRDTGLLSDRPSPERDGLEAGGGHDLAPDGRGEPDARVEADGRSPDLYVAASDVPGLDTRTPTVDSLADLAPDVVGDGMKGVDGPDKLPDAALPEVGRDSADPNLPFAAMSVPRVSPFAVLLSDRRSVLVGCGFGIFNRQGNRPAYTTYEILDTVTGQWAPPVDIGVSDVPEGLLLDDGRVFVLSKFSDAATLIDVKQSTAKSTQPMTQSRGVAASVLLATGDVLVTGGASTASAEIYHPDGGFTAVPMIARRASHSATRLANGDVLIAGGEPCDSSGSTTEIFDHTTGRFVAGPTMAARVRHNAVLLKDGRVLLVGGDQCNGMGVATAVIYNPGNNTMVTNLPDMFNVRDASSTVLLPDGRALVVGGEENNAAAIPGVEAYDPATNQWTRLTPLPQPREQAGVVALDDGSVAIVGGINVTYGGDPGVPYDSALRLWP